MHIRTVSQVIRGKKTSDGDGVKLTRIIGTSELNYIDPFLLLDEFKNDNPSDYRGGFPPHPHRGFETVTYMLAGNFTHQDSRGNKGHLTSGSVQWMTAGRGIIHSEMPAQENGLVWGFQLWLNLPARLKNIEPRYQDISEERIPRVEKDGIHSKVIAGTYQNTTGPGRSYYPVTYLDLTLKADARFQFQVPENQSSFIYVIQGATLVGSQEQTQPVDSGQLALLSDGNEIQVTGAASGARLLFLSAEALNEPIARGGPFVMNTKAEVLQAFQDYENGKIG